MAIEYEKIVAEDLNLGTGTTPVTMPGGGSATGHQVNLATLIPHSVPGDGDIPVYDSSSPDHFTYQTAVELGLTQRYLTRTSTLLEPSTAGDILRIAHQDKGGQVYNVKAYGAVGDGSSHPLSGYFGTLAEAQAVYPCATALTNEIDWAAIQTCIDISLGTGNPLSGPRYAKGIIFLPAGHYKITSPLVATSAIGLSIVGAAGYTTWLYAHGTMDAVLILNGVSYSRFQDFGIVGDGTEDLTRALWSYWDPTTSNFPNSGNEFSRIYVSCKFRRAGVEIGTAGSNYEVDNNQFWHCEVHGGYSIGEWETGAGELWQAGFYVGSDTWANNLDHKFHGSSAFGCRYGVVANMCPFLWYGGDLGSNGCDFYVYSSGYNSINGMRSEGSGRFLEAGGNVTGLDLTVRDCYFPLDSLTDEKWLYWEGSGSLHIDGMRIDHAPEGVTPVLWATGSSNADYAIMIDGMCSPVAIGQAFHLQNTGGKNSLQIRNYYQFDNDGLVASTPNICTERSALDKFFNASVRAASLSAYAKPTHPDSYADTAYPYGGGTANLLPANSLIKAVVVRVTYNNTDAGVTTFSVGDASNPTRFGTGIAKAADTTAICLGHWATSEVYQATDAPVRITTNAAITSGNLDVQVTVFYETFSAPDGTNVYSL